MNVLTKEQESPVSPIRTGEQTHPESPTTAQPLDFDDDLDSATPTKMAPTPIDAAPKPPPKDETPPAKPPRPLSPQEQAQNTLVEAFPGIDVQVVKAVLVASGGQVEPAFNALLSMSDPDSQRESEPPARPPRPVRAQQSQMEADEMYARQLQEHFASSERGQRTSQGQQYNEHLQGSRIGRPGAQGPPGRQGGQPPQEDKEGWRTFIDDDLPEIRDNIFKGFAETQTTVNRWISNFKKTLDGDGEDDFSQQQPRPGQNTGRPQTYGRRSNETSRRSADMARYDADPQVIGDDFSKLELRDGEHPPRTSSRPAANPNLFKPDADGSRRKSVGRKVSFQDGPPEEIHDTYSAAQKPAASTTTIDTNATAAPKNSKWQPLSKADPSPVTENDPFSLGDSDDERDAKPIQMKDETKDEAKDNEQERLKKAMDEATNDNIGSGSTVGPTTDAKADSSSDAKNDGWPTRERYSREGRSVEKD